jgi:hypothetical protein
LLFHGISSGEAGGLCQGLTRASVAFSVVHYAGNTK